MAGVVIPTCTPAPTSVGDRVATALAEQPFFGAQVISAIHDFID
jgi:hypothetical protein